MSKQQQKIKTNHSSNITLHDSDNVTFSLT